MNINHDSRAMIINEDGNCCVSLNEENAITHAANQSESSCCSQKNYIFGYTKVTYNYKNEVGAIISTSSFAKANQRSGKTSTACCQDYVIHLAL